MSKRVVRTGAPKMVGDSLTVQNSEVQMVFEEAGELIVTASDFPVEVQSLALARGLATWILEGANEGEGAKAKLELAEGRMNDLKAGTFKVRGLGGAPEGGLALRAYIAFVQKVKGTDALDVEAITAKFYKLFPGRGGAHVALQQPEIAKIADTLRVEKKPKLTKADLLEGF